MICHCERSAAIHMFAMTLNLWWHGTSLTGVRPCRFFCPVGKVILVFMSLSDQIRQSPLHLSIKSLLKSQKNWL